MDGNNRADCRTLSGMVTSYIGAKLVHKCWAAVHETEPFGNIMREASDSCGYWDQCYKT